MIPITTEQLKAYCIVEIEDYLEYIGGEYTLTIDDVDDLHDATIETIELDSLYYTMYSLLPQVLDDCIEYLDDAQDYWDGEAEYRRNVFGHY